MRIIFMTDKNISPTETGSHFLASNRINAGATKGAYKVVQDVIPRGEVFFKSF